MKRFVNLSNYHWLFVFGLGGVFAIAFAYSSYNLFSHSMANIRFIRKFGQTAIGEGALYQSAEILVGSCFALMCFIGFKLCESELVMRYHRWKNE